MEVLARNRIPQSIFVNEEIDPEFSIFLAWPLYTSSRFNKMSGFTATG